MPFDLAQAVQEATREHFQSAQLEVEDAIMKLPMDYDIAWEMLACFQVKLESRYEDRLNPEVDEAFKKLRNALEAA
jgi:hypothetical protein